MVNPTIYSGNIGNTRQRTNIKKNMELYLIASVKDTIQTITTTNYLLSIKTSLRAE